MSHACGRCGRRPAAGLATINGERFCHEGESPTCYEQTQWAINQASEAQALGDLARDIFGVLGPLTVTVIRPLDRVMILTATEPVVVPVVPGRYPASPWPPQQCPGAVQTSLSAPERCTHPEGHHGPCEA